MSLLHVEIVGSRGASGLECYHCRLCISEVPRRHCTERELYYLRP